MMIIKIECSNCGEEYKLDITGEMDFKYFACRLCKVRETPIVLEINNKI
jgi:hypothetical protein